MNHSSAKSTLIIALCTAAIGMTAGFWSLKNTSSNEVAKAQVNTKSFNNFKIDNSIIPLEEILGGGPPRDGIPAILNPKFINANADEGFIGSDTVISFTHNGETKAYPLKIIVWHEIVNDSLGGKPIAITYCPLCGTSMVFERTYGDDTFTFGVSGLLYNSDVLMYDHQTESLWSQLKMKAVAGNQVNTELTWLPSTEMSLGAWRKAYPDGHVLSKDTGFTRNYHQMGYQNYLNSPDNMFPVKFSRTELFRKEWVIGIKLDNSTKAYPLKTLRESTENTIIDTLNNTPMRITSNPSGEEIRIENIRTGDTIPHVKLYWFAWQAFYPETLLYTPEP